MISAIKVIYAAGFFGISLLIFSIYHRIECGVFGIYASHYGVAWGVFMSSLFDAFLPKLWRPWSNP